MQGTNFKGNCKNPDTHIDRQRGRKSRFLNDFSSFQIFLNTNIVKNKLVKCESDQIPNLKALKIFKISILLLFVDHKKKIVSWGDFFIILSVYLFLNADEYKNKLKTAPLVLSHRYVKLK